jgi:hypothetical protein
MTNPKPTTERRIPAVMERKVMAATASTVTARTSETAFANEVEGECLVCHKPMKVSETNGIDVYVCMTHRVVMPIKNEA